MIAEFLNNEGISRQAIGEYFGRLSDPLAVEVTEEFVKLLDLKDIEVDVAIRRLMAHVHPAGESQKIEFLLEVLQRCYVGQNVKKVTREFREIETVGVLAYSIMMLHTSLYNQDARRLGKPMTKSEFIQNNRGIDSGHDISTNLLEGIYDRVAEHEFRTLPDPLDRVSRVDRLLM